MNIKGKLVILRAIEEEDLPFLKKWADDTDTQESMGTIYFPNSKNYHLNWIKKLEAEPLDQRFIVSFEEVPIGISSLIEINWRNKRAWHGLMIGDTQNRKKGLGFDTVMATMRFAFDELGLHRLDGSILSTNTPSLNFYKKLGWIEEGCRREWIFRHNEYLDEILVGITSDDYRKICIESNYWNLI
jgi:RimJ/RimL family protein N-acetyltransferase